MLKDRNLLLLLLLLLLVVCVLIFLGFINALTADDTSEGVASALSVLFSASWAVWLLRSRGLRLAGLLIVLANSVALSIIGDDVIQTVLCVAVALLAIGTLVAELGGKRVTRGGKPDSAGLP